MSNYGIDEDDDEDEIRKVNLSSEEGRKLPPVSIKRADTDSDISTDSSISGKQVKRPHTILTDSPPKSPASGRSTSPTLSQNEDQAEHYQRLLQQAEQSVTSRDVLIAMLQQQLRKIENLYKQSLDDTEDIRYKYCVTAQELSNLRTITEKYREDVVALTKEKNKCCSGKELQKLQNEADEWKSQYERLLKEIKVMESQAITLPEKVSIEIQVELGDQQSRFDSGILKDYYNSIKNSLQEQNEKMELIIQKLQQDLSQTENDRQKLEKKLINSEHQLVKMTGQTCTLSTCTERLRVENEQLKKQLDKLKTEHEQLANASKFQYVVNEEPSRLLNSHELEDSQLKLQAENLKNEINTLKAKIQELNEKKAQLQNEVNEFKNENKIINNPLGIPPDHEKNNMSKTSSKCLCYPYEKDNNDKDENLQMANGRDSGVNFTLPSGHLQSELLKLQKENSELKLKIKNMQGERRSSDEVEKHTVDMVNLRRLVKQKEEEIDRLKHESETSTSRKNEIIQELNTRNELLKKDYAELLQANIGLKKDLTEKAVDLAKKEASMQSLNNENNKLKDSSKACEAVLQENGRITMELNDKIKQLDAATNDLNRQTTEIIAKKALIQTLYAEIENLKAENVNNGVCQKLTEENRKIKDELNDTTKQLDLIKNELQNKANEIIEKEVEIDKLNSEIQALTKLDRSADYNTAIQENSKLRNDLSRKDNKLAGNLLNIQNLQKEIEELRTKLAEIEKENGNYSKKLQCHANCTSKIRKLENELFESSLLANKLKEERDNLQLEIDKMTNTLQQYKEEAEFKKLENEKLRRKEEQLESAISSIQRNSENVAQEYSKEMEKTKTKLSKITDEYNDFKQDSQNKLNKLNKENEELKRLLQQKVNETKQLQDKFGEVTVELENVKRHHQKDLSIHDRSLDEIKQLYKNKEDELASTEDENKRLKELLTQQRLLLEKIQKQENNENDILGKSQLHEDMEIKMLEENYNKEKLKNAELNSFVNDLHKDVSNLKVQLQDLLKNLEYKLKQLKMNIENNKCGTPVSKKGLCEMLDCIGKFKNNMLQQDACSKLHNNNKSSEEKENYSYYYDDIKLGDVKTNQILETSGSTITDCKSQYTTTKSTQNPSTTNNVNKNKVDCGQDFSNMAVKDLHIKKQYLLKRVKSIDEKLNTVSGLGCDNQETKTLKLKRISSSESDLTSHTKSNDKGSCCGKLSKTETDDLHFKRKHYSQKIDLIDEALKITKENKQNQTSATSTNENRCSSTVSTYWKKNLEIMQQMALDINAMKVGLTVREDISANHWQNKSEKNCAYHNCSYNASLQAHIADLQEQLRVTCVMTKEIDELEYQLKSQQSKLKEFQAVSQFGRYTNDACCTTHPSPPIKKDKTEDYGLSRNVTKEQKEKSERHKPADETGIIKCSYCPPLKPTSVQVGDSLQQTCCNIPNYAKQENYENNSVLCTNSNKQTKRTPTAIPKLVQNTNKKLKCNCSTNSPTRNKSTSDEYSLKYHKPKAQEPNCPSSGIKTLYERLPVSRIQTESKGTSPPSCVCAKIHPHHPPTSQLPLNSAVLNNHNCVCAGNRKNTSERK